jgi:hypothetical protein
LRLRDTKGAGFEWAALILLVALFFWKTFVPAWGTLNTDFPGYYLAARLFRDGYPFERVYDWIWFQRQKDHAGILGSNVVGYAPSSPFSALLVAPLVGLSPLGAKHIWLLLNLGLLVGTVLLLRELSQLRLRRIALITFLTVVPLRTNFLFGQQHLLMLFLLTLAAWLLVVRGRSASAGAVIAVAAVLKIYPAIFGLYLARKRRWTALAALVVTAIAALALGVALFGRETWRVYGFEVLPRSLTGESNHPYLIEYNSPLALLRRLFTFEPQLNPNPALNAPVLYSLLAATAQAVILFSVLWCTAGRRSGPARERLELGAFTMMVLVLSTAPATYHLCPIVLSTVLIVDYLLAAHRRRAAFAVVALHAFIAAPYYRFLPPDPSGWRSLVAVPRLWAMVVLFVVYARTLASAPRGDLASRLGKPSKGPILGASMFVVVVAVAAIGNLRHVRAQAASYRSRLLPVEGASLMAAEPALAGPRVYFSRWGDTGYVLDATPADGARRAGPGEDVFHPALASDTDEGWVEIASLTSRIARFHAGAGTEKGAAWETEVESGEQPGVSPDGRWLGFIREERGRGSLWIKDRRRGTTAQVLDVTHDVRGFALGPDGRIVVASAAGGGSTLLIWDPKARSSEGIDTSTHRAKNPAVSPDGRWLAYSREERGAWQLWVMDLASRQQARVTDGDCNSLEPAWAADSRRIVYASDCGRALGRTALCARALSGSAPEPDGT